MSVDTYLFSPKMHNIEAKTKRKIMPTIWVQGDNESKNVKMKKELKKYAIIERIK